MTFNIGSQNAGQIDNVGRDQYISGGQHGVVRTLEVARQIVSTCDDAPSRRPSWTKAAPRSPAPRSTRSTPVSNPDTRTIPCRWSARAADSTPPGRRCARDGRSGARRSIADAGRPARGAWRTRTPAARMNRGRDGASTADRGLRRAGPGWLGPGRPTAPRARSADRRVAPRTVLAGTRTCR